MDANRADALTDQQTSEDEEKDGGHRRERALAIHEGRKGPRRAGLGLCPHDKRTDQGGAWRELPANRKDISPGGAPREEITECAR